MHPILLDPGAAALLETLHQAGYAAYVVGGCVRDSLLGQQVHDWDLCTSARPEQVMALFGEQQCIPTGLQHGTVTIKYGGQLYETTTFRTEGAYSDGRHPDQVQFVPQVQADLARRDFTINAMAYHPAEGLVDPFGGQQDLEQGLLRAVGDPYTRFQEDALRILRLYRFAARFGFAIHPDAGKAAEELCQRLDHVSVERIQEELAKLLASSAPGAYLNKKILAVILPQLSAEALEAAKPVLDACPAGAQELPVRWAALLGSLGEEQVRRTLKGLRCSNAWVEETAVLVREMAGETGDILRGRALPEPEQVFLRRLLGRWGLTTVQRLLVLGASQYPAQAARCSQWRQQAEQMEQQGVCCRIAQLEVNGRDLMAVGIPAGPELRRTLEALLEAVVRGQLPNQRQCLLEAARQQRQA